MGRSQRSDIQCEIVTCSGPSTGHPQLTPLPSPARRCLPGERATPHGSSFSNRPRSHSAAWSRPALSPNQALHPNQNPRLISPPAGQAQESSYLPSSRPKKNARCLPVDDLTTTAKRVTSTPLPLPSVTPTRPVSLNPNNTAKHTPTTAKTQNMVLANGSNTHPPTHVRSRCASHPHAQKKRCRLTGL